MPKNLILQSNVPFNGDSSLVSLAQIGLDVLRENDKSTKMFNCPYCEFSGKRSEVHNHLAETHPDTLGTRVDEFTGHTYYIVTCPVCGASYEQVTKKARRDPNFVSEYEYEIRLVVFDLLLYHLQGEHEAGNL